MAGQIYSLVVLEATSFKGSEVFLPSPRVRHFAADHHRYTFLMIFYFFCKGLVLQIAMRDYWSFNITEYLSIFSATKKLVIIC